MCLIGFRPKRSMLGMMPQETKHGLQRALARIVSTEPLGFREFIWLCLPALLLGLVMRLHFLWVTPQGYFGADSGSYYQFAHDLFTEGVFELNPKRRWFYPIVLALLTPLPAACWYLVPLFQHLLGLATVVGIGWITLRLSTYPRLTIPLVTILAALWPRMLWYEHEFIAESFLLAAFVLTVSLALIPGVFKNKRGLLLLFLSMILLAGFKAAGRFLWLGVVLGVLILAGDPRRWAWAIKSALAAIACLFVATIVGKSSQGYWLLLNSVLPLVQDSGEPHSQYRKALSPLIQEARSYGDHYPWEKYRFKKILNKTDPKYVHPDWSNLLKKRRKYPAVVHQLATEAIRKNPGKFLQYSLTTFAIAAAGDGVNYRFQPPNFWREQIRNAENKWRNDPSYLTLAFRVDRPQFDQIAAQGGQKTYSLVAFHHWVDNLLRPLGVQPGKKGLDSFFLRPFGLLIALGFLRSLRPGLIRRAALLLLPSGIYLFAVFAVGDAVSRYLHPVEWVAFLLAMLAIEALLRFFLLWNRQPSRSL